MAKQPTSKGGTSRIRFIMVEAEIPEGELSQITSAIQNALKPNTTIIQQRISPSNGPVALSNGHEVTDVELDEQVESRNGEVLPESAPPRPAKEARARKPPSMKVLDLDLTSDPSLGSFASNHVPKNDTERHLVCLAWFKEHRQSETVTANHIYTCYRAMKWPSGIEDFPSVLRSLKAQQLVKNPTRGHFEINHLGIARVEKMGPTD